MTAARERLEALLASKGESALLRFSLGLACRADAPDEAIAHLRRAVELDPGYSAAWKELGRTLADRGQSDAARDAFGNGITIAEQRGDMQAAREMRVFLKRLGRGDVPAGATPVGAGEPPDSS